MGFLNKLFGNSAVPSQKKSISVIHPQGKRVRTWFVGEHDGNQFCVYAIYQSEQGFQVFSIEGALPGLVKAGSVDGFYPDLKAAMHGCLLQLAFLVYIVLSAKVESLKSGKPWGIRNPRQLILLEATWAEEAKGLFPLGQVFFDEEKLEVVEALVSDPDTGTHYDRVGCRVLANAIGVGPSSIAV